MRFEDVDVKQVRAAKAGLPAQYLVTHQGEELGLIERHKGKASSWQAYHGIGQACRYLGAWYGAYVGRIQARNAVLEAAGLLGAA